MEGGIMRKTIICVIGIGLILTLASCASISYKPSLSLNESPKTIKVKALIETFIDESPAKDKTRKFGGTSAVEPGTISGDLATEVTNAVLTDFSINQVFKTIKKRIDDPDIIVKGNIRRFYAKGGPNTAFWITIPIDIIWLFGVPVLTNKGAVDLEISIYRPNGSLVGRYSAKSQFKESHSIYSDKRLAIGTQLNKAFSESISKIRQQILADESKFYR